MMGHVGERIMCVCDVKDPLAHDAYGEAMHFSASCVQRKGRPCLWVSLLCDVAGMCAVLGCPGVCLKGQVSAEAASHGKGADVSGAL